MKTGHVVSSSGQEPWLSSLPDAGTAIQRPKGSQCFMSPRPMETCTLGPRRTLAADTSESAATDRFLERNSRLAIWREEAVMIALVRRTFEVDAPLDETWAHLAHVESWPSWAKHIRSVTLTPPGMLTDT